MAYVVGLTGGIGSGKSTIAELFAEQGATLIDADIVAREVVALGSPLLAQIAAHFGEDILQETGELNRTKLRKKIFHNTREKDWLNALLHPAIRAEMLRQLAESHAPYVIWVVPLLIENQLTQFCDRVLVVDVQPNIQLTRAIARDHANLSTIENIMRAQVDRDTRLNNADDIIDNNAPITTNLANIRKKVAELHQFYLQKGKEKCLK